MNRRGFIAAILAAPLAAVGSFAGNHNEGSWVELIASDCHIGNPETFQGPVAIWTVDHIYPDADWVLLEFGDGRVLRHQKYTHKQVKLPFVNIGDLCDQDKLKGTLLA